LLQLVILVYIQLYMKLLDQDLNISN
jgi:hypothetical protein